MLRLPGLQLTCHFYLSRCCLYRGRLRHREMSGSQPGQAGLQDHSEAASTSVLDVTIACISHMSICTLQAADLDKAAAQETVSILHQLPI